MTVRRSKAPTMRTERSNRVVVVGGDAIFHALVENSAKNAFRSRVYTAELDAIATVATTRRPFAIVAAQEVHDFGGPDLDALARDINAELIVVPQTISGPVLTALLLDAAAAKFAE